MNSTPATPATPRFLWSFLWLGIGLAAFAWWRLMAQGFPPSHLRFWANTVIPPVCLVVALLGIAAGLRPWPKLMAVWSVFPVCGWLTVCVSAVIIFPVTAPRFWPGMIIGGLALALLAYRTWRWHAPRKLPAIGVGIAAVLIGWLMVQAQQADPPGTRPLNEPFVELPPSTGDQPDLVKLGEDTTVRARTGQLETRCNGLTITLKPLLTFSSRSPDRCWTNFAARKDRQGPSRELTGWRQERNTLSLQYRDDDASLLTVRQANDSLEIEAKSRLPAAVFSHLNSWCVFEVIGHKELALSFSPCPDAQILIEEADYPVGRPIRFAYVDPEGVFHVAEASSGEKGPFTDLATGKLEPTDALVITLVDRGMPVCRLVFDDWARQASLGLSPTAGWGVPANAIEFQRTGGPAGRCYVYISLAATSVGRGWDSTGHAPGTYRNRMRIVPAGAR